MTQQGFDASLLDTSGPALCVNIPHPASQRPALSLGVGTGRRRKLTFWQCLKAIGETEAVRLLKRSGSLWAHVNTHKWFHASATDFSHFINYAPKNRGRTLLQECGSCECGLPFAAPRILVCTVQIQNIHTRVFVSSYSQCVQIGTFNQILVMKKNTVVADKESWKKSFLLMTGKEQQHRGA